MIVTILCEGYMLTAISLLFWWCLDYERHCRLCCEVLCCLWSVRLGVVGEQEVRREVMKCQSSSNRPVQHVRTFDHQAQHLANLEDHLGCPESVRRR